MIHLTTLPSPPSPFPFTEENPSLSIIRKEAAIKIQALFKRHLSRKSFIAQKNAAIQLQSIVRMLPHYLPFQDKMRIRKEHILEKVGDLFLKFFNKDLLVTIANFLPYQDQLTLSAINKVTRQHLFEKAVIKNLENRFQGPIPFEKDRSFFEHLKVIQELGIYNLSLIKLFGGLFKLHSLPIYPVDEHDGFIASKITAPIMRGQAQNRGPFLLFRYEISLPKGEKKIKYEGFLQPKVKGLRFWMLWDRASNGYEISCARVLSNTTPSTFKAYSLERIEQLINGKWVIPLELIKILPKGWHEYIPHESILESGIYKLSKTLDPNEAYVKLV